ncbi:MAG: glycoside hydrolase family 32 protein, partial [Verrucomicrobiaceae bacterium]
FLTFLIAGGDHEHVTCLDLLIEGKVVRSAGGRNNDDLAPVTWDLSGFEGKSAKVRISDLASGEWGHVNVDSIVLTDEPAHPAVVEEPLYQEAFRPQFHFTARQWTVDRLEPGPKQEGWLNDLNGLVYYEGEWHLFAQRWWKCWLHAVSTDLIHWRELEPAFYEESLDSGTQSGTCVIDYGNTSGLSPDGKNPPMVAFWTRKDSPSHGISYSLDRGRTWTIYPGNPVLVYPERDPKVFWHEKTKRWVMMLYGHDAYHVLTSGNLLDWKDEETSVPKSFECPDLFELPVDCDAGDLRWVLVRGDGKYSTGSFDGRAFKEDSEQRPCDVGPNFYATQTWENTSTGDGRRIQVAWMRGGKYPGMPFNQQVSFPCELTLRKTSAGILLFRQPIAEISKLHDKERKWTKQVLASGASLDLQPGGDLLRI